MSIDPPGPNPLNRSYPYLALGVVALGVGLRLIGLDKGLWLDEYNAIDIAASEHFIQALHVHDYPPTYFYLLKLWSFLGGSEPSLRLLSVFFGVMTMLVVMVWLKPVSRPASLLSGLLIATSPILLRYSQEIQAYPLLIFATTFAFYCAFKICSGSDQVFWPSALAI
ncbi:MAG: phospholipid carrier-dependent glycosyltransferase, partial [Caldilineaceae bacterium]|nr:phospholipid carrier-dependent glycosyltransferase [Caldilineaceae bacterium]